MLSFSTRLARKSPALAALLLAAGLLAVPAGAQDAAPATDDAQVLADATAGIWWNRARFVDRLALSDEQRQQMDTLLAGHLEKADLTARAARQKELSQALVAGEWDKARGAVDALNSARAEAFSQQTELKIEVLALLESNQRKTLSEDFPRLIERPWLRPGRGGAKSNGGERQRQRANR